MCFYQPWDLRHALATFPPSNWQAYLSIDDKMQLRKCTEENLCVKDEWGRPAAAQMVFLSVYGNADYNISGTGSLPNIHLGFFPTNFKYLSIDPEVPRQALPSIEVVVYFLGRKTSSPMLHCPDNRCVRKVGERGCREGLCRGWQSTRAWENAPASCLQLCAAL